LRGIGLRVAHRRISDVTLAFVAGTHAIDGCVLVAGTGAVAGNIRDRKPTRYADGHGWLLGDRGSGVWIGRRAVESVLSTVDSRMELSAMHRAVLEWLEVPACRDSIYAAVYGKAPAALAGLAGTVLTAAAEGDGDAARILAEASSELLATAARVRDRDDEPLVLAGGLLTRENPLATRVFTEAALRWPGADITVAGNTAEAAARLALSAYVR
jgi:N-acetylglucosamine kinase-like BadF-type ATPase